MPSLKGVQISRKVHDNLSKFQVENIFIQPRYTNEKEKKNQNNLSPRSKCYYEVINLRVLEAAAKKVYLYNPSISFRLQTRNDLPSCACAVMPSLKGVQISQNVHDNLSKFHVGNILQPLYTNDKEKRKDFLRYCLKIAWKSYLDGLEEMAIA